MISKSQFIQCFLLNYFNFTLKMFPGKEFQMPEEAAPPATTAIENDCGVLLSPVPTCDASISISISL